MNLEQKDFYQKSFKDVKIVKYENYLLHLNLNIPQKSNAISMDMIESLEQILNHAKKDIEIRVVLISGEGKNFCAGGDIDAMKQRTGMFKGESAELRISYQEGVQRIPKLIESFQKPIIALVNGAAAGAGCDLAMMCDLRIGNESAIFCETFVKLGLVPGDGGTFFLSRVVGYAKAMELLLTGRKIDAGEALAIGILNKIVSEQNLYDEGYRWAELIAKNAPIAVALTKRALKEASRASVESQLEILATYQAIAQRTQDHEEGLRAYEQKRPANFRGL